MLGHVGPIVRSDVQCGACRRRSHHTHSDCFTFWSPTCGITFSDAVNGRFPAIRTTHGTTWQDIGDHLPAAQPGEAAIAASGTCVTVQGGQRAWIATSGAAWTSDEGSTWSPLPGVTNYWAVAFASPQAEWLVGTEGRILKISF